MATKPPTNRKEIRHMPMRESMTDTSIPTEGRGRLRRLREAIWRIERFLENAGLIHQSRTLLPNTSGSVGRRQSGGTKGE